MHIDGQESPKPGNGLTTRELADAINELIGIRIALYEAEQIEAELTSINEVLPEPTKARFSKTKQSLQENAELVIRKIADGFKSHSGARGVYHE